jgi:hypothetical protein
LHLDQNIKVSKFYLIENAHNSDKKIVQFETFMSKMKRGKEYNKGMEEQCVHESTYTVSACLFYSNCTQTSLKNLIVVDLAKHTVNLTVVIMWYVFCFD